MIIWIKGAIKTLTGKTFYSFPADRQLEVEQILTARHPKSAGTAAKTLLTGLRIAIHLLRILTDSKQYQELLIRRCHHLRVVIGVEFGCGAAIDPNLILILLIMGKAIHGGMSDYAELKAESRSVAIWPGKSSTQVGSYYLDYLRLMLLLIPRPRFWNESVGWINRMFPETSLYRTLGLDQVPTQRVPWLCGSYQ